MQAKFEDWLHNEFKSNNCASLSKEKYESLIEEVSQAKSRKPKQPRDYWLLKHYDVLSIDGKFKLIYPVYNSNILFYVTNEELFTILQSHHSAIGHGGRDKMVKQLNTKFKNITYKQIQKFIDLCEPCLQKKKLPKKGKQWI